MKNIGSLAYRTDLSLLAFQGRIEEREEYFVAESLGNPGYFWGNLLVMKNPPKAGDYNQWMSSFENEFQHQPLIKHKTFGWDSPEGIEGDIQEFLDDGFEVEQSVVLTLKESDLTKPKHACVGLVIRPLSNDKDWESTIQNQVACRGEDFDYETYLSFKRLQMKKYREMTQAGHGQWFGAFLEDKLVGDCGLFVFDGVGRYQAVGTNPNYRRRSVCAHLIYESAHLAFEKLNAQTLVMVAEPEYHAAKVYESVGFQPTEKSIGICRYPKDEETRK